jgi:hypothetical protein
MTPLKHKIRPINYFRHLPQTPVNMTDLILSTNCVLQREELFLSGVMQYFFDEHW